MVTITLHKVIETDEETGSDQFTYTINNFNSINIDVRTPISPMPLPEETSEENVLVKVEGNTTQISLSWTLVASDTDLGGGGKQDSAVQTVREQLLYLSKNMQGSSLQHRFMLKINYSELTGVNDDLTYFGFVNNISFDTTSGSPITLMARLTFLEGSVVTTMDGDTPFPPTSIGLTDPGGATGRVTSTWTAPTYKGGADAIVDYDLEFFNTTTGAIRSKKYGQASSPFTNPDDTFDANEYIQVRIRANSTDGKGIWSAKYPLTDETATTPDGVQASP
jgi:hypothetical protein